MADLINIASKASGDTLTAGELNTIVNKTNDAISEQNQTKAAHAAAIAAKVDKVAGKGLSTEDYTTEEKNKLANLNNETAASVKAKLESKAIFNEDLYREDDNYYFDITMAGLYYFPKGLNKTVIFRISNDIQAGDTILIYRPMTVIGNYTYFIFDLNTVNFELTPSVQAFDVYETDQNLSSVGNSNQFQIINFRQNDIGNIVADFVYSSWNNFPIV